MLHGLEQLLEKDPICRDPWIGRLSSAAAWARASRSRLHPKIGSPICDPACLDDVVRSGPFKF